MAGPSLTRFGIANASHPTYVGKAPPSTLTTGTDTTPVSGTVYFGDLYLPQGMTITGVGYLIGTVGGTDKAVVAIYNRDGKVVANSATAGETVGTAATFQQIALTAIYDAPAPDLYYVSISFNGTTARIRLGLAVGARGGSATGTFGTLAAITTVTTNTAAPIAYVY